MRCSGEFSGKREWRGCGFAPCSFLHMKVLSLNYYEAQKMLRSVRGFLGMWGRNSVSRSIVILFTILSSEAIGQTPTCPDIPLKW